MELLFDDIEGSLRLLDAVKSMFKLDGQGTIYLQSKVFRMDVEEFILNARHRTQINTQFFGLHALESIQFFTTKMKQNIRNSFKLFTGKSLFSSRTQMNLQTKDFQAIGSEKMLLHSDKMATLNSHGTAEMLGKTQNKFENISKEVSTQKEEPISLAVVHFRPKPEWKGEFGFDWLRTKDNKLSKEPAYEDIIEGGYKEGKKDLSNLEAFAELKKEYETIVIKRKDKTNTDTEYFVPYLTLFSKEFMESFVVAGGGVCPPCEATLELLVDIEEEEIESLSFEYDEGFFELNIKKLSQKTKTEGLVRSTESLSITCLKDLTQDHEIKIYALAKGSENPLTDRSLAGKIIVLKNDQTARKEQKFVLVEVNTKTNGILEEGTFSPLEKINFYNFCYQSLIIPIIEISPNVLDLTLNKDFIKGGKYLDSNNLFNEDASEVLGEIKKLFLEDTDSLGNLKNQKYAKDYFTAFVMEVDTYDGTPGQIEKVGVPNLILFNSKRYVSTMSHETLHGFGLHHTHRNDKPIKESTRKYIYQKSTTTNVMSYNTAERVSTWHWQWKIINPNIT